ncbi:hypothetical protein VM1G_04168 [Cytospora mali]|uniref:Uncharacterized protein n=1 Tax=Cytospora mali TaxID=578113 RepID=A0A194VVS4_CYTMA|nr:hypothetical protein VM1G_04168 [Valsa mali]
MPPLSPSPSPPAELLEQELRTFTLQKASQWRGKKGSLYNTTRMKLVYNTFAPILFGLAEYCDPDDIFNLRELVLGDVRKFDICVAQHCREVAETVKELWSLGVFHWKDCRAIVFGSAIAAPAPLYMGRKRGRRERKKNKKKGKKGKKGIQAGNRPRKPCPARGNRGYGGDQKIARAEGEPIVPSMTHIHGPQTSLRGDRVDLQVHHGGDLFNPSTINAHDEGDPDVTMVDLSPATAVNDNHDSLPDVEIVIEYTGIDIFKVASSHDARDGLPAPPCSGPDAIRTYARSLEDAYKDNPDAKLSNVDEQTLGFAGEAVKQVVLEATYEFLQKCVPVSDQQEFWNRILERVKGRKIEVASIAVPDGALDLKNGMRPMSHLIGNCIRILSQDFAIVDQKNLNFAFNQGIALCDALDDGKRKQALERALHSLNWLMLGLDWKTIDVYRHTNQELDRINANYPDTVEQGVISIEGISNARLMEEHNLLWAMKSSFEKFKEPFRVNFVRTLQRMLAAGVDIQMGVKVKDTKGMSE